MPFDTPGLQARTFPPLEFNCGSREAAIYALCAGMGQDPLDRRELGFVDEPRLKVLPTLLTAAAWDHRFVEGSGIDVVMMPRGAQRVPGASHLTVHAPLPLAGTPANCFRVTDTFDKGAGRGTVIVAETELREKTSGKLLCTHLWTTHSRGEGSSSRPPVIIIPEREPDAVVPAATSATSLHDRPLGDVNPLHVDPGAAIAADFPRPILHGLFTSVIACRAVVAAACAYEPERLSKLDCRFVAPAFAGDTIDTEVWLANGTAVFRSMARERGVEVARGQARATTVGLARF